MLTIWSGFYKWGIKRSGSNWFRLPKSKLTTKIVSGFILLININTNFCEFKLYRGLCVVANSDCNSIQ
jgi:hypothetical protein